MAFRVKFKVNEDNGHIDIIKCQVKKEAYDIACKQLKKSFPKSEIIVYKPTHYGR